MTISPPKNKNYAAVVVDLEKFEPLQGLDRLKAAKIFGNSVIVAADTQPGTRGLFFPVETALSAEFLGANNLFRHPEWGNQDKTKKGYFEENGRIRAVRFKGNKSEGFWIPLSALEYLAINLYELTPGLEFDEINGRPICKKYEVFRNVPRQHEFKARKARPEDNIVENQFRFHIDTENLRRNIHQLSPDKIVSISDKQHGTSAVFANLQVKRKLTWIDRVAKFFGANIEESKYGLIWSSRRVVKGVDGQEKADAIHYYDSDVWGIVASEIGSKIPKGYTLYGEIVGYTPDGAAIQKGYTYGCAPGQHKLLLYRATVTNDDGDVLELSWPQLLEFAEHYGLEVVPTYFHGKARDFYPFDAPWMNSEDYNGAIKSWREGFLARLEDLYVTGRVCNNNPGMPAEGVVVKVDRLKVAEAYKCKSFEFLELETKMLDQGVLDIESEESVNSAE